ncbi:hypothetical protein ACFQ60_00085 [Streptomyces zhihengii]
MDARRLGVGLHLLQAFLTDAALDYLSDDDYDLLSDGWAEQAYAELAEPVHGKQAPCAALPPVPRHPAAPTVDVRPAMPPPAGPVFRLADYLEQHGRITRSHLCPPASFWNAAHTHLTHPDDLYKLAEAARKRHRLQWAHHLYRRAASHGNADALVRLAGMMEAAGDRDSALSLAREAADRGDADALVYLARTRGRPGTGSALKPSSGRQPVRATPTPWCIWLRCGSRPGTGSALKPSTGRQPVSATPSACCT